MAQYIWLIPVGFVIGAYGTLIGAGGGFVLVPLLLLLYPEDTPDTITSISLAVVFFNALSGSIAYARKKRIDFYSGLLFAAAAAPGAVLGALTTVFIPRRFFDLMIGFLMLAAAAFLFWRPGGTLPAANDGRPGRFWRRLVEADGTAHEYSYNRTLGVGLSFLIGYISSLLGIGGGFIHVPALVHLLNFPVHIATATSHFILSIMAFAGTATHVATGAFEHGVRRTIMLSIGVTLGAPLGARLSGRIRGDWILRGLAAALALVGARLIVLAL
ncbi:MAG TPA: sulfite exporter TauE/SafE family protein [Candidatus Binatia bacterium]